jgi:hypothetical protein
MEVRILLVILDTGFALRALGKMTVSSIYLSSQTSSNRKLLYWLLLCGLKFLT